MSKRPHSCIAAIIWKEWGTTGMGTGFMISKNLVLTAAHNFYLSKTRVSDKSIKIYPGACGELKKCYEV